VSWNKPKLHVEKDQLGELDIFPPLRDKNWDDQSWQIAKNLREEIAIDSSIPGMIWNPANPQYLLRNGCR
jgi:hypothetical protein